MNCPKCSKELEPKHGFDVGVMNKTDFPVTECIPYERVETYFCSCGETWLRIRERGKVRWEE